MVNALAALFASFFSVFGPIAVPAADPPPSIPTLPAPAAYVVEVLAPSVSPVCAASAVVGFFGPALLATAPQEVKDLLSTVGPAFVILCGAVPAPDGKGYTCQIDSDILATIGEQVGSANQTVAALALVATPSLGATLANQARNIQKVLPAEAQGLPMEPTIAGAFQCKLPVEESFPTPAKSATTPGASGVEEGDAAARDTIVTLEPLPSVDASANAPDLVAGQQPPSDLVSTPGSVVTYRFQYAGVLLVPIGLLIAAAFAGRTLTRELEPRRRS